jgi:5-methyltetrahydrofolate--homocysteine methyltransferase
VHVYSNAGLPNAMGGYDDTPADMAMYNEIFFENKWLNMVGGCCGSTPAHIAAMKAMLRDKNYQPRALPPIRRPKMWLSGLEDLVVDDCVNHLGMPFLNVGERCNISGSIQFKKMIIAGKYMEAMDVAKKQVADGAHVIDINVDDGMLDGLAAMQKFVKIAVTEPEVAKVPFMLDASKFEIVLAGLKWCQGKPIVNSISLKVGEALFIEQAILLRKHGAAIVVMAFDELGQAATKDEKVRICKRSYDLLVGPQIRFPPEDIIFDPNVLTIGTGMEEHQNYAVDFIDACKIIKEQCPYVKISGGISNLSFGFRGVNIVRESIHSVFLHHASLEAGMDVGIVNAHEMIAYEDLEPDMYTLSDNLVFNRCPEATDDILERTTWEKDAATARKKGTMSSMRKKPKVIIKGKRLKFWYDDLPEREALEPPAPVSDYAQNKIPASYMWSEQTHSTILESRAGKLPDVSVAGKAAGWSDLRINWSAAADSTVPTGFPYFVRGRDSVRSYITDLFNKEVTMYDGAMGTMIQKQGRWLDEEAFRGERFKDWTCSVKGNNDMLSLSQPQVIKNIYLEYLRSGSRLIGTNTFSSTQIAQADYKMESLAYELNYAGARLARDACDEITREDPTQPRFVVGALGPTNRTGSISPSVEDPAHRNVTFDELVEAYFEQVVGLMDGGADIIMVETIFDTLNAKAALFAIGEYLERAQVDIPVFVSGTLVDLSGRTLSGQTTEAFYASIRHSKPMCVGLNCALGAQQMVPFVKKLSGR